MSDQDLASQVQEIIHTDRVVIFCKDGCSFCDYAIKAFEEIGQPYSLVDLTGHPQGPEVQQLLGKMTGASTVPRVFIDGKCIGGGTDTVELQMTGRLQELLGCQNGQGES